MIQCPVVSTFLIVSGLVALYGLVMTLPHSLYNLQLPRDNDMMEHIAPAPCSPPAQSVRIVNAVFNINWYHD